MKILFITDSHIRNKNPISRTDNILKSVLEKMRYVLEFAKKKNAIIIHGGDLFHTPSPPDSVATEVANLFEEYQIPFYMIVGNHDVVGGNVDGFENSKLGLFQHYDWFHFLSKEPIINKDCIIVGYDFNKLKECEETIDPVTDFNLQSKGKPIITVVHRMIVDEQTLIINKMKRMINYKDVIHTGDYLLCGHYHFDFGIQQGQLYSKIINIGSMTRLTSHERDVNRKPKMLYMNILNKEVKKLKIFNIPCKKDVFDLTAKMEFRNAEEEKQRFIEALEELKNKNYSIENIFSILEEDNIPQEFKELSKSDILQMCLDKLKSLEEVRYA